MTGLVAPGVDVDVFESFGCAESVDSVGECSITCENDLCCGLGLREGLAVQKRLPFGLQ